MNPLDCQGEYYDTRYRTVHGLYIDLIDKIGSLLLACRELAPSLQEELQDEGLEVLIGEGLSAAESSIGRTWHAVMDSLRDRSSSEDMSQEQYVIYSVGFMMLTKPYNYFRLSEDGDKAQNRESGIEAESGANFSPG